MDKYIDAVVSNKDIVKFIGEFDHVFSGEYPDIPEAHEFVEHVRKNTSYIEQYVCEGIMIKASDRILTVIL